MIENDPKLIFDQIKKEVKQIEREGYNREVLDSLKSDFLELMELLKLYLITNKDAYYGSFFLNMKYKVDFTSDGIAAIELDTYPPVFVANPLLLCKFNIKQILFIICHEIEHVILNHPAEMLKSNPQKDPIVFRNFNYAADASVNDRLKAEKSRFNFQFLSFPKGCIDSKTFKEVFSIEDYVEKCESYYYYFNFIEDLKLENMLDIIGNGKQGMMNSKIPNDTPGNDSSNGDENEEDSENENNSGNDIGDESGDNQSGNANGSEPSENDEFNQDGNIKTAANTSTFSDHSWDKNADLDEIEANTKAFLKECYNQMSSHTRGTLPNYVKEAIEKIDAPAVLSWKSLLKKYVGTVSADYKPTRTRLNRRQPNRFDLSGKMSDKTIDIVVAIDTSGSMSNKAISYIFNEITAILSKKKYKLTIIEFDAQVQKVYQADKPSKLDYKIEGRGGTSYTPVINYINENKKYRDSLLIFFTDGCAEYEIPKPKVYRLLWVILGRKEELSVQEPYGNVVEMRKDEYE